MRGEGGGGGGSRRKVRDVRIGRRKTEAPQSQSDKNCKIELHQLNG